MNWRVRRPALPLPAAPPLQPGTPGLPFEQMVLPHLDAAYALARWLMRDATAAEDVVQEAVLRALGYYASFRGGDARAWLLRIVRNTALTVLAARRPGVVALEDDSVDEVADPADDPEIALRRREDRAVLRRALAALPEDLRTCIVLRELQDLSYKEIAVVTGVPVGTVMSRLWRARRALLGDAVEGSGHGE